MPMLRSLGRGAALGLGFVGICGYFGKIPKRRSSQAKIRGLQNSNALHILCNCSPSCRSLHHQHMPPQAKEKQHMWCQKVDLSLRSEKGTESDPRSNLMAIRATKTKLRCVSAWYSWYVVRFARRGCTVALDGAAHDVPWSQKPNDFSGFFLAGRLASELVRACRLS